MLRALELRDSLSPILDKGSIKELFGLSLWGVGVGFQGSWAGVEGQFGKR